MSDESENTSGSGFTAVGAIRAGFEFQDTVALRFAIEMLEHPDRYQWMMVEESSFGFLDDIVLMRADGSIEAYQAKFSTNPDDPDDPYSFEDLLHQPKGTKGPKDSLLQKWFKSFEAIKASYGTPAGVLITNRRLADDIASTVRNGCIQWDAVDEAVQTEMLRQLGELERIKSFLSNFRIEADQPSLSFQHERLIERFRQWGVTTEGWYSLRGAILKWASRKDVPRPGREINVEDIREAAQWNRLRGLNQDFAIPDDFVLPSETWHLEFVDQIKNSSGNVVVLTGPPGVGKSTYISHLCRKYDMKGIPFVRHHYFLSLDDPRPNQRFDFHHVLESLMHDMRRDHRDALGGVADRNPQFTEFRDWLEAIDSSYEDKDHPFVMVIDGLDHVWRERDHEIEELRDLFNVLLPVPQNTVLLVGTQPVSDNQLPHSLLSNAPRDSWRDLPYFDVNAVERWVTYHLTNPPPALADPENGTVYHEQEIEDIALEFFVISEGHPLHLRYSLQSLYEQGVAITRDRVSSLPACPHQSISDYYLNLWTSLHDAGRSALCLIAAVEFLWPEGTIPDVLVKAGFSRAEAQREWSAVKHLLFQTPLGWRPLHGSLGVFVASTSEYSDSHGNLLEATRQWLETEAPDHLRWAHLWIIQARLGHPEELISKATRDWAVESLSKGYPADNVFQIVELSAKYAFEAEDFETFAARGLLCDYVNGYALELKTDTFDRLTDTQLILHEDAYLSSIFEQNPDGLSADQLKYFAYFASTRGRENLIDRCRDAVIKLYNGNSKSSGDRSKPISQVAEIECIADSDPEYLADLIDRNKSIVALPREIARALRVLRAPGVLRSMVDQTLPDGARPFFIRQGILGSIEDGVEWDAKVESEEVLSHIYKYLVADEIPAVESVRSVDLAVLSLEKYQLQQASSTLGELFYTSFFLFILTHLCDFPNKREELLESITGGQWIDRTIHRLEKLAEDVATKLNSRSPIPVYWLLEQLNDLPVPDFLRDRDDHPHWQAFRSALPGLVLDTMVMASVACTSLVVTEKDIQALTSSRHTSTSEVLAEFHDRRWTRFTDDGLERLWTERHHLCHSSIEHASESGAEDYALLSAIFAINGFEEYAKQAVRSSVELCVVHGWHKDVIIYHLIDTLEDNSDILSRSTIESAVATIAPAVDHIEEFTDGDETSQYPIYLGELLRIIQPTLLVPYYLYLLDREQYYYAEKLFNIILPLLDLSHPLQAGIGSTILDGGGWAILKRRAEKGIADAQVIVDKLENYFGPRQVHQKLATYEGVGPENETKEAPSPEIYPPDKLDEYLDACRTASIYGDEEAMRPWVSYWESKLSAGELLQGVMQLERSRRYFRPGFLTYDLEVKATGRQQALETFIRCCQESRILSSFNTPSRKIGGFHSTVAIYYPRDWKRIIKDILFHKGSIYRYFGVHDSFRYIVGLLSALSKPDMADHILMGVINTLGEVLAPFNLGVCEWIEEPVGLQEAAIKILFSRLSWPSGMVRERGMVEIANLIVGSEHHDVVQDALMEWIKSQKLENHVSIGLFILLLSREKGNDQLPKFEEIVESVRYPSSLSDLLLHELIGAPVDQSTITADQELIRQYDIPESWELHYKTSPGIIARWIQKKSRDMRIDLFRHWAYHTKEVASRIYMEWNARHHYGRPDDEHYMGFEIKLSETAISGYLRVLTWLASSGRMDFMASRLLALEIFPVDLDLIRLTPRRQPEWWPKATGSGGRSIDDLPAMIMGAIKQRLGNKDEEPVAYAKGRVDGDDNVVYEITVVGTFQWCTGPDQPDASDVFEALIPCELQRLEPERSWTSGFYNERYTSSKVKSIDDWSFLLTSVQIWPNTAPRWQEWRLREGIMGPCQTIAETTIRIDVQRSAILYYDGEDLIATWFDWTDGLTEKQNSEIPNRHGNVLTIQKEVVDRFNSEHSSALCWVCEIRWYQKETTYAKPKTGAVHFVVGASKVISSSGPDDLLLGHS